MRKVAKKRRPVSEINVVPYIDVMLVLLVIFMATAPLLTQGVDVELPKAASEPIKLEPEQPPLIISIKADGSYFISVGEGSEPGQEKSLPLADITDRVAKVMRQSPNTPVLIRGDKKLSYGVVVELMSELQSAGAPNVGLVTEAI